MTRAIGPQRIPGLKFMLLSGAYFSTTSFTRLRMRQSLHPEFQVLWLQISQSVPPVFTVRSHLQVSLAQEAYSRLGY